MFEYVELDGKIYRVLKYVDVEGIEICTLLDREGGESDGEREI